MTNSATRILCVGEDATLLASRCAVLSHGGYCADFALLQEAKNRMSERHYDVVILSTHTTREEKDYVMADAPPAVRLLEIERLTAPKALLASVELLATQRL